MIIYFANLTSGKKESRAFLKNAICRYTDDDLFWNNHKICVKDNGKPYIPDSNIHFSISHTGSVWACAVSDHRVGFDIQLKTDSDYKKIAKRFFTEAEYEYVCRFESDGFFKTWTYKEAFAKYSGQGILKEDFRTISIVKVMETGSFLYAEDKNKDKKMLYFTDIKPDKNLFELNESNELFGAVCSQIQEEVLFERLV